MYRDQLQTNLDELQPAKFNTASKFNTKNSKF